MDHLQMSKSTLLHLLRHAKENPVVPVKPKEKGSWPEEIQGPGHHPQGHEDAPADVISREGNPTKY